MYIKFGWKNRRKWSTLLILKNYEIHSLIAVGSKGYGKTTLTRV
jgi:replication-associated recombination protein RarA